MLRLILIASAGAVALSGAALAADLRIKAPPRPLPPPPPIWTGWYGGLNAGYTWSNSNAVDTVTAPVFGNPNLGAGVVYGIASANLATFSLPARMDGFIGGGQIGYNHQFAGGWVAGLELDFQGAAARGSSSSSSSLSVVANQFLTQQASVSRQLDYLGTVRGRLGFTVWPTLLMYGTGGLAYGRVGAETTIVQAITNAPGVPNPWSSSGSFGNVLAGWTAGGGLEWMLPPNWSVKVEYLYYDLGRATYALSPLVSFNFAGEPFTGAAPSSSTRFNGNIVRVGINYHFNWGYPAAVVAKN